MRRSRGLQPANLTLPTRLKPSVKDSCFFCQVMCWPPEGLFQLTFRFSEQGSPGKTVVRHAQYMSQPPNSVMMQLLNDRHVLGPKTLCLTSVLLIRCSHQILPIVRRQRWSNTDGLRTSPAFSGQVSEPYSKTERTAAEYTLTLVDNLMSFRRHRGCKLEKASHAFWMSEDNSWAILPPIVMQLIKWVNLSTLSMIWPLIDKFGVIPTQPCGIIFHFWGAKRIPNVAADLSKLSGLKQNDLLNPILFPIPRYVCLNYPKYA